MAKPETKRGKQKKKKEILRRLISPGALHTYTNDSKLYRKRKERKIEKEKRNGAQMLITLIQRVGRHYRFLPYGRQPLLTLQQLVRVYPRREKKKLFTDAPRNFSPLAYTIGPTRLSYITFSFLPFLLDVYLWTRIFDSF